MGNIFDDELDEYAEQQVNTPTVPASVPTAAPQQKNAELAEIEKSLEVLKGIKEIQGEMRNTMSELKDMAEQTDRLTKRLSQEIKEAKPVYDQLLKGFIDDVIISKESLEAYDKLMLGYTNKIVSNVCGRIDESVTENISGQFNDVANKHIADFDEKMKKAAESHKTALSNLEKEYKDKIASLENKQAKLLAQAIEAKNSVLMPASSFWTIACICGIVILCGFVSWLKFWRTDGNDETMTYMTVAFIVEIIYYASMVWNYYTNSDRKKTETENKEEQRIFCFSLSQAIYIIALTFSAGVYLVWSQMTVTSNTSLLLYLLPVVFASNFIWLFIRALAAGIFGKA